MIKSRKSARAPTTHPQALLFSSSLVVISGILAWIMRALHSLLSKKEKNSGKVLAFRLSEMNSRGLSFTEKIKSWLHIQFLSDESLNIISTKYIN